MTLIPGLRILLFGLCACCMMIVCSFSLQAAGLMIMLGCGSGGLRRPLVQLNSTVTEATYLVPILLAMEVLSGTNMGGGWAGVIVKETAAQELLGRKHMLS